MAKDENGSVLYMLSYLLENMLISKQCSTFFDRIFLKKIIFFFSKFHFEIGLLLENAHALF
jgi:hypothetical protein